ncbi:MAG: outer membrane beta-barrel protein [Mucilaginibacter sp.]
MRFTTLLCLSLLLLSASTFAQSNFTAKGVISDSVANVKLFNTSIAVLNAKDSTLVGFARTAEDGSFSLSGLNQGKFILLVAYPDYADYVEGFNLDSINRTHNFGGIHMQLKSRLLQEVIIKAKPVAIKIKGDTTEFNAAAYTVQPNAKVEDLLKQLPGIQVDKDGKITAQGQTVSKVLVDGEEFFGDDPTLVTKNIRADMVDKVQLYDKKSDQATFTGIDDGQKTKTLNIKLKADKKNGMFGKTEDGGGTDGYYQGQILFNAFKNKQKFSVYGTMSNNSKIGLGWDDNQKYGTGDGMQFDDSGSGMLFFGGGGGDDLDSFDGRYNGQGIPIARTGGVHYDNKWDNDKQSINTNFKIGSLTIDGTSSNLTQNNLRDTIYNTTSGDKYHKYMFRQKLDVTYQVKLDTSSNLKIIVDGTTKHSQTIDSATGSESRTDGLLNDNSTLINKNSKSLINNVDQKAFNASALYTKKFKKTGRTFSFNIKEAYSESQAKGNLNKRIDFYNPQGNIDSSQLTDQYKTNDLKSNSVNTNLTYSEPFTKTFAVVVNYGIGVNNSNADRKTFDPSSPGNYNVFINTLSSDYKLNQFSNSGGAIFNYKKGKTNVTFGTRVVLANFHQVDMLGEAPVLDRSFVNWNPQASYQYRFSQQKSLYIRYNGNTTQPTLEQIQPLKDNTETLNTVLGNPLLKPSFTNSINFNYNSYKILTSQYVYIYGNYSFTSNPIVSNIDYNKDGTSTSQYVNLPGKGTTNFYFGGNFNRKFEKLDFSVGMGLNANGSSYYNYVNNVLNLTKSYSYGPQISFQKYKEKKIEIYISGGPTYNISQSSLQTNTTNNGAGFNGNVSATIYLPLKFQIGTYSNYDYTAKTQSFPTDFSRTNINAFLIKTFLKGDNLKFTLWGNDLLNQNVGFSRNASANIIQQSSYTTIKRYFMLSVAYDFSKAGGGTPKK